MKLLADAMHRVIQRIYVDTVIRGSLRDQSKWIYLPLSESACQIAENFSANTKESLADPL